MKVQELFVTKSNQDTAKMMGCRWDPVSECWYCDIRKIKVNINAYKKFEVFALIDTNEVSNDCKKGLGCLWNGKYQKWTIQKDIYKDAKAEFDRLELEILAEITRIYEYLPPDTKTAEEQLQDLMMLIKGGEMV